ncbi:hypothetical protein NDU88_005663 [Pleurodeles waltl]|uniref:Uncharacterized protein n=1 Tax=Pleurodeles waltl TaxID=8319 RepID=A0AAV7VJQ8_PLEWA|nr:hypothetical protein NDU88_005663 [Pleurodeles waltl]
MGVPRQEQPVKSGAWQAKPPGRKETSHDDARNRLHSAEGSEKALRKQTKSQGRNTAERLRDKRELNAYLRSAAGETNVQKNVRLGPRGASAPIIYAQIK